MATQLLDVERLSKRFGGFVALDEIDLSVAAGERVGLIAPTVPAKSTLVNCLCGTLVNEAGTVRFEGRDLAGAERPPAYAPRDGAQLPAAAPFASMTIADNLKVPLLYTVNARRQPLAESESERAARSC